MSNDIPLIVDPTTGELCECKGCIERDATLASVMRKAHSTEQALKRKLAEERGDEPLAEQITEVLEYAIKVTRHPRLDIGPGTKRWDKVRSMLKRPKWTVRRLKRVADGAAARPFVVNGKRSATGAKAQRYDKPETIFADVSIAERLEDYANEERVRPLSWELLGECWLAIVDLALDAGLPVRENGVYTCLEEALGLPPVEERLVVHDRGEAIRLDNVVPLRRKAS